MEVLRVESKFEHIGNRFKNPLLVRFFNDFHKNYDENQNGIGRITSPNEGEFFSREYLDFLSNVVGTEKGLKDFLIWVREELLTREHIRYKITTKYTPTQFVEILFLMFYNQRELTSNSEKPLIEDIFNKKVYAVLEGMKISLDIEGLHVYQQLETTIHKGYFPISSEGELLIFVGDLKTGLAQFIAFPSGNTVTADKSGQVLHCTNEVENDEDESETQEFLDTYYDTQDFESMTRRELVERIHLLERQLQFHTGKGIILTHSEHELYNSEFDNFLYDEGYDQDEVSRDFKKRCMAEYEILLKQIIAGLGILLKNKHILEDMAGIETLVNQGALQVGPRSI